MKINGFSSFFSFCWNEFSSRIEYFRVYEKILKDIFYQALGGVKIFKVYS